MTLFLICQDAIFILNVSEGVSKLSVPVMVAIGHCKWSLQNHGPTFLLLSLKLVLDLVLNEFAQGSEPLASGRCLFFWVFHLRKLFGTSLGFVPLCFYPDWAA